MNSGLQGSASSQTTSREAKVFHFKALLQPGGWLAPAFVEVDERGIILKVSNIPVGSGRLVEYVNGFVVPGFQNAHSHAFQYAMAGTAEKHAIDAVDDFWSWRESMYACALALDPDQLQAVATMLYVELLKRGYTHVAEFQYLHHDKRGEPYDRLSEMSLSLLAAAAVAGIKITLVPVFYRTGGFGKEAASAQRRFCFRDVDQYFTLLEECMRMVKSVTNSKLGFGVHSLRAASTDDIGRIVSEGPAGIPFHMHAAEQLREVEDCRHHLGQRPVEWLLDHIDLNDRFHLVHCTHLTDDEVLRLAQSRAHVVLCPGTEANLGDGVFRLGDFARHSDHWSIGTDSHISLNPLEDLRWLDYAQRLSSHRRNTFPDAASVLVTNTFMSGKAAMGIPSKNLFFEVGTPLDAVVYNADSPLLKTAEAEHLLATLVYTADASSVTGTVVDGKWICKGLRHRHEEEILNDFTRVMKTVARG